MLNVTVSNSHNSEVVSSKFEGFGAKAPSPVVKKIIRKKSPVSFERRFLSEKCPSGDGVLEVALMWRGEVMSLNTFKREKDVVTIGNRTAGKDKVTLGVEDSRVGGCKTLLSCHAGKWYLDFERDYDGFLVVDKKQFGCEKLPFSECYPNDVKQIRVSPTNSNALCIPIDGVTRALVQFGDVRILVHMAKAFEPKAAAPFRMNTGMASGMAVSVLLHAIVFATMLFATDRASALNIDRIMTSSRFAEALLQPNELEEEKEVDKEDEFEEPDDIELAEEDTNDVIAPSIMPSKMEDRGSGSGSAISRSQAIGMAKTTGLLAQANAMNSMIGVGVNLDNMALDWSNFDESAQAESTYGLNMRNTGGGGDAFGSYQTNGIDSNIGNNNPIRGEAKKYVGVIPDKKESQPVVPGKPETNGGLDQRTIQGIVRKHTNELRACYERELNKVKGLSGKITVKWFITIEGNVANAMVTETSMRNKNVEACLVESIKHWRFPRAKGGAMTAVVYPFTFTAGSSDK